MSGRTAGAAVCADLGELPKNGDGKFVYFSPHGVAINEEKCYNIVIGLYEQKENKLWHLI